MSLSNGAVLSDRYRIDGLLGEGGMGAVYRGFDLRLNLVVAVKESLEDPTGRLHRSTDPQARVQIEKARERFQTEAQVLARLHHPGLPRVMDHFVIPEQGQYLVMDLVEGQDLQSLVSQAGILREDKVLDTGIRICEILEYLHSQNPPVIHRDIKPANIRMTPEGKVVLVDFGICKEGVGQATKTAARAVSEGFSPLEMYGQYGGTDTRSDIYSLGATLFALLTGQTLPSPTDRTLGHPLPQLRLTTSSMTARLGTVLERALALKPEDRYQTAHEIRDALNNLNEEKLQVATSDDRTAGAQASGERTRVVQEELEVRPPTESTLRKSKKWLIIAGGLAIVVVAVFLAVYLSQRPQTSGGTRQPEVIKPNQTGQVADSVARIGEQRSTPVEQKTETQTGSLVTFILNTEAKVKVIGHGEKTGKKTEFSLNKGDYKYIVTAKGYEGDTGMFSVKPDYNNNINVKLQAIKKGLEGPGAANIKVDIPLEEYLPQADEFVAYEEMPVAISLEQPVYPPMAQKAQIEGTVIVKVLVDKAGNVRDAIVLKPSGANAGFEEAALEAAKKGKWKPAIQNKQPIAVWLSYPVHFQLRSRQQ